MESVAICMPVLNEIGVIEEVLGEWLQICEALPNGSYLCIEDGGSSDGTVEYLREVSKSNPLIRIIEKERPEGFGVAAKSLFKESSAKWIFFTDSDGQYIPEDFWLLWDRRQNFDIIRGAKLGRQDPMFRRLTSFFWNKLVRFLFELQISDINSAFILIENSHC